ncbi:MAG: AAA family ATPase, partial [Nannocystaceae bacterium]
MHTFPGFELLDEASPGRLYTTYRATRRSDGSAVFIKCSYMDGHGRGGLSSLRREYEVLKRLREYPVVQPLGFEPCEGGAILILERNPQMESLASCFQRRGALGLDTCLRMGVEIAKALVGVHAAGILHNSLSLNSVVVSQEGDFARLARFSRACEGPYRESSRENGCTDNYFLAPERLPGCQRRVDGRSDLYAVGCILYNLLAGRPPFAANSRASLRHAQRVLAPVPLSVHRPGLMPCVIDIVHTLLLKDPGARLPDAKSLARDLAACREQQGRSGAALPAATQAPRKPLPWEGEPLIGRESQVSQIISSLRRCRTKRSMEVVMVKGSGGSGKTRLIHEVAQTAGSGAATVVTHRCCSIGSDRPWSAVFPLLDQLLQRNIESFPERRSKLIECRSKLFEALGPCVGIPQRAPSNRTPSAVRQGIFELIGELVSECSRARMCVLVLDDIHYADSTSLAVLGQLNRHGPRNRVVLIASYLSESDQERRLHRIFATRPVVRIEVGKISVAKWLPALPTEIRGSLSKRLLPLTIRLLGAGKGVGTRAQPTPEDPLEYLAARGANLSTEAKLRIRSMAECEYTCLSPLKKRVLCSLLKCEPVALESTLQTAVALGMVERGSMWEHGQSVVWQPCIRRWLGSGLKRRHRRRLHQMLAWEYYQQVATYKYAWIEAAVHLLHVGKALHSEM